MSPVVVEARWALVLPVPLSVLTALAVCQHHSPGQSSVWTTGLFLLWLLLMAELRFYCFEIDLFSFLLLLVSYFFVGNLSTPFSCSAH